MSKIVQLYSDNNKNVKAYPKAVADEVYCKNNMIRTLTGTSIKAIDTKDGFINNIIIKGNTTLNSNGLLVTSMNREYLDNKPYSFNIITRNKNLYTGELGNGYYSTISGNLLGTTSRSVYCVEPLRVDSEKKYTVIVDGYIGTIRITCYSANGSFIDDVSNSGTLPSGTVSIKVSVYTTLNSSHINVINSDSRIMIVESGDGDPEKYLPPQFTKKKITSPVFLCDGNEINLSTSILTQRTQRFPLTGYESWSELNYDVGNTILYRMSSNSSFIRDVGACTSFPMVTYSEILSASTECFAVTSLYFYLRVSTTKGSSVLTLKDWLKSVDVECELKYSTPIYYKLDSNIDAGILRSYEDITYIDTDLDESLKPDLVVEVETNTPSVSTVSEVLESMSVVNDDIYRSLQNLKLDTEKRFSVHYPNSDGILKLNDDFYQFTELYAEVEIQLPKSISTEYKEIHLYFRNSYSPTMTLPNVSWKSYPNIPSGAYCEFIFRFNGDRWLGELSTYS